MSPEEINAAIKDVVTAYATDNNERAEQVLHQVLQAKMQAIVTPAVASSDEHDIDPEDPDAGEGEA